MRRFKLSEMLVLSEKEKGGRRLTFDPSTTVIEGQNDTGKSALIKSIYWALGAEPVSMTGRWASAAPTVLLKAEVDGVGFHMLRKGTFFAAFTPSGDLLGRFESVTKDLTPFLAERLGFALRLPDRGGEMIVPPPAYMFLPFYVDQDASWNRQWSGFNRLTQFANWQQPLVEYHTGIRNSRWYDLRGEIADAGRRVSEAGAELGVLKKVRSRATAPGGVPDFHLSIESYREQITELLDRCAVLNDVEGDLRRRIADAGLRRQALLEQSKTVELAMGEIRADGDYAVTQLHDHSVECPTCGAEYENSFQERFAIAEDEARLVDFLAELADDVSKVDAELETLRADFSASRAEAQAVQAALNAQQGDITLRDIIQNEGRREFKHMVKSQMDDAMTLVREAEQNVTALKKERRALGKELKEQRDSIEGDYVRLMRRNLHKLNVMTLEEAAWNKLTSRISDSGSGQPRALMAYYFAFLEVIHRHGSAFFAPIIIDEPNQQGQDDVNMRAILEFVSEVQPEGSQLVLGVESDHGVDLPGTRLILSDKLGVLAKAEYEDVRGEMASYLDTALLG